MLAADTRLPTGDPLVTRFICIRRADHRRLPRVFVPSFSCRRDGGWVTESATLSPNAAAATPPQIYNGEVLPRRIANYQETTSARLAVNEGPDNLELTPSV